MSEQTAQEPTMEEILASIRRIISEDDAPAAEAAPELPPVPVEPEDEDVLELTDAIEAINTQLGDKIKFEAYEAVGNKIALRATAS